MTTPNDVPERLLIVYGKTSGRSTLFRLSVCTADQWPRYERNGWRLVAIDPEPYRYEDPPDEADAE